MALIDWLLEDPMNRAFRTNSSYNPLFLYQAKDKDADGKPVFDQIYPFRDNEAALIERLGGRDKIDTSEFNHLCIKAIYGAHHTTILRPSRELRDFWKSEFAETFQTMKAAKAEQRKSVERQVILGRKTSIKPQISEELRKKIPEGVVLPLPVRSVISPRYLATVTKETPTRLYLTDVKAIGKTESYLNPIICGREPNQYAVHEDIVADNADEFLAEKITELVSEYQLELNEIANNKVIEILPALLSMNDRFIQKEAAMEDMLKELIDNHSNGGPSFKP